MKKRINFSLLFCFCLVLVSCETGKRNYENDYLKLTIPENWITLQKNNMDDSIWLKISLVPIDDKFSKDLIKEASYQNLTIVATNQDEMSQKGGWYEFNDYAQKNYDSIKKSYKVSEKIKIKFKDKESWYYETFRNKNGAIYQQRTYNFKLEKFYISIISTQLNGLDANDIDSILKSIELKNQI